MPSADWASVRRVMADFADTAALSKRLFRALKLPVNRQNQWVLSAVDLFRAEAALFFWSEHPHPLKVPKPPGDPKNVRYNYFF